MKKKLWLILVACAVLALGYGTGLVIGAVRNVLRPHERVLRSPERVDYPPLGTLVIPNENPFFRRVTKAMRSAPPLRWLWGWRVWSMNECATGSSGAPRVSDDGDIVFDLRLDEDAQEIFLLMDEGLRLSAPRKVFDYIHCEIPYDYREDFPIIAELRKGLSLRVCGRFVWDRAWGHNEFHPVWWMEKR